MKILLINNNPVVSRLTALSARKEEVEIDEIQEVTELSSDTYDIVFVDADSWSKDVKDVISDNIKTQKSVLFYADGDEEEQSTFDISILKPYLPSEVSAVIRSIEQKSTDLNEPAEESHFDIIGDAKASKRDELFDLDGIDAFDAPIEKEEVETPKLGEPVNLDLQETNLDEKLEEAFPLKVNSLDDDLLEDEPKMDFDMSDVLSSNAETSKATELKEVSTSEKEDNELFNLDLSDEIAELDDDLFNEGKEEIASLKMVDNILEEDKTSDIVDDGLLELDQTEKALEVEAFKSEEEKVETQVLDESEIEKIKGILTEDTSDELTLNDLMSPSVVPTPAVSEEEIEAKEETKGQQPPSAPMDAGVLAQTLTAMPVEALRELLAGAKVHIKIKFPKSE